MENFEIETRERQSSRFATGMKYGLIAGAVYILLLLVRYMFFGGNPMIFTGTMFISYLIILSFFVQAGVARRKELGGFADVKDIFSAIFVVIIIAELCYAIFNYVYLNFIDPDFYNNFMQTSLQYVKNLGGDEAAVNQQIEKMQEQMSQSKLVSTHLRGLAIWIVVDSIIGFIIALILKKNRAAQFN